ITGADTLCLGDSATLSATTAGGSWGSTNTLVVAVSAAGRVFAMGTGLADVVYTVANMCDTVTATHHVYVQPAGLCLLETGGPSITEMQVALYPNPSGGRVVLEAKQTTLVQFVVTDMAGRTVLETTPAPGTQRLDVNLSHLSAGMYLYRITTSNGLRTGKLVLE
ncbi:MAG: T9SS C-terminal target domain-containing protein, partial [Chitinophagia bacterium]|nr:T9SS C-terminal target domain-containing protein [Chitinophagia bacterium]